jgi:hypothetical protein
LSRDQVDFNVFPYAMHCAEIHSLYRIGTFGTPRQVVSAL